MAADIQSVTANSRQNTELKLKFKMARKKKLRKRNKALCNKAVDSGSRKPVRDRELNTKHQITIEIQQSLGQFALKPCPS